MLQQTYYQATNTHLWRSIAQHRVVRCRTVVVVVVVLVVVGAVVVSRSYGYISLLPLPTLFYRPEAANLGDLMRLWVRPGVRITQSP